jgi:hypothetical protein
LSCSHNPTLLAGGQKEIADCAGAELVREQRDRHQGCRAAWGRSWSGAVAQPGEISFD